MADWYYRADNGPQQGPLGWLELVELVRIGELRGTDMIWTRALGQWTPVSSILQPPKEGQNLSFDYAPPDEPRFNAKFLAPPEDPDLADARRHRRRIRAASNWFRLFAVLGIVNGAFQLIAAIRVVVSAPPDVAFQCSLLSIAFVLAVAGVVYNFVAARAVLRGKRWPLIVFLIIALPIVLFQFAMLIFAVCLLWRQPLPGWMYLEGLLLFGAVALIFPPLIVMAIRAFRSIPAFARAPEWCRRAVMAEAGETDQGDNAQSRLHL